MARIKGQEVKISFTNPDASQGGLDNIVSFDSEMDMEILREQFLGQTADEFDDIFKGFTGSVELQLNTPEYFRFQQRVQDRAQRRTPAAGVFNIGASFEFPDGQRFRMTFENVFFGPMPVPVSGRAAYVSTTINWGCKTARRVL